MDTKICRTTEGPSTQHQKCRQKPNGGVFNT